MTAIVDLTPASTKVWDVLSRPLEESSIGKVAGMSPAAVRNGLRELGRDSLVKRVNGKWARNL